MEGMTGRRGTRIVAKHSSERIDVNVHSYRYEGFVGPREEEGVQVDYISECSMLNCVPNVIYRLEGEVMKIWTQFTNGSCIAGMFMRATVAGHDIDGQVRGGNDLRQWVRPDCNFHGVVNDVNCVRNKDGCKNRVGRFGTSTGRIGMSSWWGHFSDSAGQWCRVWTGSFRQGFGHVGAGLEVRMDFST